MKKYRVRKSAKIATVLLIFTAFVSLIFYTNNNLSETEKSKPKDLNYVNKTVFDDEVMVSNNEIKINKPFLSKDVKVLKDFYDYKDEELNQENSIIFYESTYMQNCSIAYGGVDNFDIVSILDGKVISVKEDDLVGTVIEIEHQNKIISIYQSVKDVLVKQNDVVKQGQKIASSGESNLNKDLKSHLLFELIVDDKIVDPEFYFDKNINNIKE
ncbi:MAG: M23 family metallopeptidase [Bacilli bacterium]